MKRNVFFAALLSATVMCTAVSTISAKAINQDSYEVKFHATVTDAGETIDYMTIDYGDSTVSNVTVDTYTVGMTSTVKYGINAGKTYAYRAVNAAIPIIKVETDGGIVKVYFDETNASTLNWLSNEGRNTPAGLDFTITQNSAISRTTETQDKRQITDNAYTALYTSSTSSYEDLTDEETAKFTNVQADINYEYHKGTNNALIIWFHGNGEGDIATKSTNNNAAQMLANRGTVAWASDEAQSVFGDATVMSFQSPDMWYLAEKDNYLARVYNEIQSIIKTDGIDASQIYVAGCSAGGYMTTKMVIAYPTLFKVAMINCPALDIADLRNVQASGNATEESLAAAASVGATPTDEEIASLKNSDTAIWLIQGETDSSVNPDACSKRIWNILTEGEETESKKYTGDRGIASGFTTYETSDNKYKLTLYETTDTVSKTGTLGDTRMMGQIVCAEDYDQDGVYTAVKYNDHWTWIFTLRNNPASKDGSHIWQWAVNYKKTTDTKNTNKVTTSKKTYTVPDTAVRN
jgi:predicted peptidase